MELENLKQIANMIMAIDHVGMQADDIYKCEHGHQAILALDKLDKHVAVRLLMHIIHVQQLQLCDANIEYSQTNPFKDMVNFDYIDSYIKGNSPEMNTLY